MNYQFLNVSLRVVTLATKLILILFMAKYLPPEEVGLYGLITVTVTFSIYFVGFEFYTYSTRELIGRSKNEWPKLIAAQVIFFVLLYLLVLPWISLVFIFDLIPQKFILACLVLIVLEHLSAELMRLLVAMEKPLLATMVIFIKQGLWSVCFIVVMWLYPSVRSIEFLLLFWVAGVLLGIVFGVIPLLKLGWTRYDIRPNWTWVKKGIWVAFPLLISSVSARALFTLDRFAFEAMNDLALLGVYTVFVSIASSLLAFMESGVFVFYYPKMVKAFKSRDFTTLLTTYSKLIKQSLFCLVVLAIFGCIFMTLIVGFIENKIYSENINLFYGILISILVFIVGYVFQYALYATSNDKAIVISNVFGLFVFVVILAIVNAQSTYWAVTCAVFAGSFASGLIKYSVWKKVKIDLLAGKF